MADPRPMTEAALARLRERSRENTRRYRDRNREKVRASNREQKRKRARETPPEVQQAAGLWKRHRISPAEKQAMLDAQRGCCYLCGDVLSYDDAFIDHDHSCCALGRSCPYCRRGLACDSCNTLIGYARDDPARLMRIASNLAAVLPEVAERMSSKPQQLLLNLMAVSE